MPLRLIPEYFAGSESLCRDFESHPRRHGVTEFLMYGSPVYIGKIPKFWV
jgi:hypothetical protein